MILAIAVFVVGHFIFIASVVILVRPRHRAPATLISEWWQDGLLSVAFSVLPQTVANDYIA